MKKLLPLLILLCFVVLFTGCPPFPAGPSDSEDPVTITFWHIDGGDDQMVAWRQIADNFERENPGVKIEITVMENNAFKERMNEIMVNGENPPDIFRSWGGGVLFEQAEAGLLKDIGPAIPSTPIAQLSDGAMGLYAYNGKQYGAPYSLGRIGLWYNKAVLADCGLTEADFDTWTVFLDSCEIIKGKGYVPIALGGAETWAEHYWWTYPSQRIGGQIAFMNAYKGTGTFKTGAFLEGMKKVEELRDADLFQDNYKEDSQGDASALVANGTAAMTLMGQWAPQGGRDMSGCYDAEFGLMLFPTISGGVDAANNVQGGGDGYVIGKNAPAKAVEFLVSFYKPENYRLIVEVLNAVPVIPGYESLAGEELSEVTQAVISSDYFQLYYDQFFPYEMGEVIKDATDLVLMGQKSAQDACNMIQDKWDEIR